MKTMILGLIAITSTGVASFVAGTVYNTSEIHSFISLNGETTEVAAWSSMEECQFQVSYLNNVSVGDHFCVEK